MTISSKTYDISGAVTIPVNGAGAVPAAGTWVYGSVTYPGTSSTSWSAYDAPQLYSTTGGYTATETNNPLSAATHLYLGAIGGSSAVSIYFNWNRARFYPPNGVMPSTSFAALVTTGTATSYDFQHKLVYSQGLWWAFYSDGTNIGYRTSADGSVWSSETILTSSADSTDGYNFNIWVSGNTFYYVLDAAKQSASFSWRYGALQSGGTINWAISQTTVSTTNKVSSYDSIVTDSSGNVWVALNTNDGTNAHIEVWKYSSGSWAKEDDISPQPADITPILVPLSNGIALIYGEGSVTAAVNVITTTTGASWSSPVSPSSDYMLFSSSATAIGNTLYFVGLASGSTGVISGTVNFWSFANGASATSSETQLQSSSSGWLTSISQEPSETLIVFYGSGTTLSTLYSTNFGNSWSCDPDREFIGDLHCGSVINVRRQRGGVDKRLFQPFQRQIRVDPGDYGC